VIPVVLTSLAIVSVSALAFGIPARTGGRIARYIAGVALAVQIVAYLLGIIILAGHYSLPVLLWIVVCWLVFPVTFTALGLALTLRDPPGVVSVWAVSIALFAMSLFTIWSVGVFIVPSALLMFLAAVFALGSRWDQGRVLEPANG
jgi:hypothetical protein